MRGSPCREDEPPDRAAPPAPPKPACFVSRRKARFWRKLRGNHRKCAENTEIGAGGEGGRGGGGRRAIGARVGRSFVRAKIPRPRHPDRAADFVALATFCLSHPNRGSQPASHPRRVLGPIAACFPAGVCPVTRLSLPPSPDRIRSLRMLSRAHLAIILTRCEQK